MTISQNQGMPKLIFALKVIVGFALIFSLLINLAPFCFAWSWLPEKPFEQLPSFILGTATLIAIFTYDRERKKVKDENQRISSESYYLQACKALDEVFELLKDQNNDRIIWVRAARTLMHAIKLSEDIKTENYKSAYHLHARKIRDDLYLALTIEDPKSRNRISLSPQFFYGIPDWKTSEKDLDIIAKEVEPPIEVYSYSINKVPPMPDLYHLSEKSVCAIFNFLEYPTGFKDPLDEVKLWDEDWTTVLNKERVGAAQYIAHRKKQMG